MGNNHALLKYLPPVKPIAIMSGGKERVFDLADPQLPDWVTDNKLSAGGYPYDKRMKRSKYEKQLEALQEELVKLQYHLQATGDRVIAIFEGRDAAGKGGTINRMRTTLNPRSARNVALAKPTDTERGQWYFQRYVAHFPTAGEFVTFDRSWYNRAGVEPVMGFCTPEQHRRFLAEVPDFERMIREDQIHFFKFWLNIGRETQLRRFHDRYHSPLKCWKFSPIDIAGIEKWEDYTKYRDIMMEHTHLDFAPWTIVRANDKRRARLAAIRHVLAAIDYKGADRDVIGEPDDKIIGQDVDLLGD